MSDDATVAQPGNGSDEQASLPAKPTVPKDEAIENVQKPRELTGEATDDITKGQGDVGAPTLSRLARLHLFVRFFCWLADRQYPANDSPDERVTKLRAREPWFYWLCVLLDTVVAIIAVAILIVAAAAALYKTIWLTGSGQSPPLPGH